MSRDQMRCLKIKKDHAKHLQNMKNHVTNIYKAAIDAAESFGHTSYSLCIDPACNANIDYEFYKNNMEEILAGLQALFPDSYVTHTMMCTGPDGKMYDVSKMENASHAHPLTQSQECIVIDWS